MRIFITGGAGFIGSNLTDRLLLDNHEVTVFDNFSTGQKKFLQNANKKKKFCLIEGDLLDQNTLNSSISDHNMVFHLAANADVRFGIEDPRRDLEQNTVATHNLLEAMRNQGIRKITFASTGSIYGESSVIPTPEDAPFPIQTSLYAASKLAGEGLISAYSEGFNFESWIFRFVSILGERYTHGHVFDFYRQLKKNSSVLNVLGNGKQRKSYLYIQDCIEGLLLSLSNSKEKVNIFNLGFNGYCQVNDSIRWICQELNASPTLKFSGGDRGWIGDNPFIFLETKKIQSLGWNPKYTIQDSIKKTVQFLKNNEWVFNKKGL